MMWHEGQGRGGSRATKISEGPLLRPALLCPALPCPALPCPALPIGCLWEGSTAQLTSTPCELHTVTRWHGCIATRFSCLGSCSGALKHHTLPCFEHCMFALPCGSHSPGSQAADGPDAQLSVWQPLKARASTQPSHIHLHNLMGCWPH